MLFCPHHQEGPSVMTCAGRPRGSGRDPANMAWFGALFPHSRVGGNISGRSNKRKGAAKPR